MLHAQLVLLILKIEKIFGQECKLLLIYINTIINWNRDSAVGIANSYGLDDRGVAVPSTGEVKNFLFTSSRPTLGPTQLPVQWVPGALSMR
jgi:hypothetical protein